MLTTITPTNTALQPFIDFFYFFESDKSEKWSHVAFPHVNTGLSFFTGALVNRYDNKVLITEDASSKCSIEVLGKYTSPVYVICQGAIHEVAIVFKPLGINRFIRDDFNQVAPHFSQPFFNHLWLDVTNNLFTSENKIQLLEEFLFSVLSEREEFIKMQHALSMFENSDLDYSVAEVANNLNLNLKTFQRNFTKMMACSPSDYKRIARFRNSLQSKLLSDEIKSLTSITYEHNYTDQSYFIREFRKLTNQNPKLFFKEVSKIGGDKIFWEIL